MTYTQGLLIRSLVFAGKLCAVDCSSAEVSYAEQAVAWNPLDAPLVSAKVKLTRSDLISY